MKKTALILTAVISAALMCVLMCTGIFAAENVVYLRDGGTGDGKTDMTPVGSLGDAYAALGDNGGTIVVCGSYDFSSASASAHYIAPAHKGAITVTQKYGDKDYRAGGESVYVKKGSRWALGGPTTYENINFKNDGGKFILFVAQFNPITMGDGVVNDGFTNKDLGTALTVMGGYQKDFAEAAGSDMKSNKDANITINSGKFIVVGCSRQVPLFKASFTGAINITVNGGEITKMYAGNVNDGLTMGKLTIKINGGKIAGNILANNSSTDYSYHEGDVAVIVTGGEFAAGCKKIAATASTNSYIDISAYSDKEKVKALADGFANVFTEPGQIPVEPETTEAPETTNTPEESKKPEETKKPAATTKIPETTKTPETAKASETTAPATTPAADDNGSISPIVFVIAGVAAAAVVAVVAVVVIKKKKAK